MGGIVEGSVPSPGALSFFRIGVAIDLLLGREDEQDHLPGFSCSLTAPVLWQNFVCKPALVYMCQHGSLGKAISSRISGELYPFMDRHILAVEQYIQQSAICSEAGLLIELFYRLKSAFEEVKVYTVQFVFPAVLSVFDTKDKPGPQMTVPVAALQQTAWEKENVLMQLVSDMEQEAEWLMLPETHPAMCLLTAFNTEFAGTRKEWRSMLQGWNNNCACFAAAQTGARQQTAISSSLENR